MSTEWRLIRKGKRGNMHPAFPHRNGKLRTLCGKDVAGDLTVWGYASALAAWENDEARHCAGCENRINADMLKS
jgi:hypothetical protein